MEKDLVIMITTDGRCSGQVEAAVIKSWTLGRIRKTFRFFNLNLFESVSFVKPHLEFASSVGKIGRHCLKKK